MKKTTDRVAVIVTVRDAAKWTNKGRREVAAWLRRQAEGLEQSGEAYTGTCRMRYLY